MRSPVLACEPGCECAECETHRALLAPLTERVKSAYARIASAAPSGSVSLRDGAQAFRVGSSLVLHMWPGGAWLLRYRGASLPTDAASVATANEILDALG